MSGDLHRVRLNGPAKVGERWLKPGPVPVSADEKAALEAEGLVDREPVDESVADAAVPVDDLDVTVTMTKRELVEAVAAQAKALSEAVTDAAIEQAMADVIEERDRLKREVADLQARIVANEARIQSPAPTGEAGAVDGSITSPPGGATAPADKDTPPSAKAAKTAPKKGAAAIPKG